MDNLEKYCDCWRTLKPEYKNIKIIPESEIQDSVCQLSNRAIMTFSGGLDASFTLFRHKTGQAGRNTKNIERSHFIIRRGRHPTGQARRIQNTRR